MTFLETAREQDLPIKMMYTLGEVADVTGYPYNTVLEEVKAGRLRCKSLPGKQKGFRVKPEWVDEWVEAGQ